MLNVNKMESNRGVTLSFLLQGEPLDELCTTKPIQYQGIILNSQNKIKAHLLFLGADVQVSRTKLLEEGGYDVDIGSTPTFEEDKVIQGIKYEKDKPPDRNQMKKHTIPHPFGRDIAYKSNFKDFSPEQSRLKYNSTWPDLKRLKGAHTSH